jgi:hypothetical protein
VRQPQQEPLLPERQLQQDVEFVEWPPSWAQPQDAAQPVRARLLEQLWRLPLAATAT